MKFRTAVAWLALAMPLSACNEPAHTPAVTTAAPGGVSGDFEMLYRGASTRFQADSKTCPSPGLVTIRPQNGVFTYRLGGRVTIETTIIGDGTLAGNGAGANQDYVISGTATAAKIEGDIRNGQCGYHFRATRQP
jgi:hypothetical protein